jgi:hypothetical protein
LLGQQLSGGFRSFTVASAIGSDPADDEDQKDDAFNARAKCLETHAPTFLATVFSYRIDAGVDIMKKTIGKNKR